jgi:hypothetical protein
LSAGGLVERLYRSIDRRLFGAAPEAAVATDGFRLSFEGLPAPSLADAVRRRIGLRGATVRIDVHRSAAKPHEAPVFSAHCALDHRSLARSIDWVRAKVPAALQAARARTALGAPQGMPPERPNEPPRSAASLLAGLASEVIGRLRWRDQWFLQLHAPAEGGGIGPRLATIEPPADAFWADPFLHEHDGRLWLFIEELPFAAHDAHLSAVEIDRSGRLLGAARPVLREPWHLSYPFIWAAGNHLFMIPESSAHLSVDLYECTQFPFDWRKRGTLLEGAAHADATVVSYQGRLWMFSAGRVAGGSLYDELHIHSAERIEGPWRAHPLNPVKIDARHARPAGRMWIDADGALIRPVQDCSTIYGGAIRLQKVTLLDDERFAEVDLGAVEAPPALAAARFHTLNAAGGLQVVDALRRVPRRVSRAAQRTASPSR